MTTELKPGTPEYDEAYEKEMARLEAEAKASKKDDAAAATTSEAKDEPKGKAEANDGKKDETAEELKARLDKAERELQSAQKALKDTQRWGHQTAAMVKKLQQEAEQRKRSETLADDPLIKANPGLKETIERVAGKREEEAKPDPKESWLESVSKAIPDVETLLGDQAFYAKAKAKQHELGPEWDDPFVAIRELSDLKASHVAEKRAQAAVEQARRDFQEKKTKRNAMDVPGGSGGKDSQTHSTDEAERYRTMPKAEFDKIRSKVMGY